MRRRFGPKLIFGILVVVPTILFGLSWTVMCLWNFALVPGIGVAEIDLWQAMAILILSKILFTGIRPRGSRYSKNRWKERWGNMSDEDREKFKERWKQHGRSRDSE